MIVHVCAQTPLEVCWDLLMDLDGPHAGVLWRPLFEYALLLLLLHTYNVHIVCMYYIKYSTLQAECALHTPHRQRNPRTALS